MSEKDTPESDALPPDPVRADTVASYAPPWFDRVTSFDPSLEGSALAIEIVMLWGDAVLFAGHLAPPRSFHVGEVDSDLIMPREKLGASRIPLVLSRWDGLVNVVLPRAATGTVETDGAVLTLQEASTAAGARPSAVLRGATELPLKPDMIAWIHLAEFSFRVSTVRAGRPIERTAHMPARAFVAQGVSTVLHLIMLGAMALLEPASWDLERYEISPDQRYELQKRLAGIDEKEEEREEQRSAMLARGERRVAAREPEFWYAALSQPSDPQAPALVSRAAGWEDNPDFSMIGLLYAKSGAEGSGATIPASLSARSSPSNPEVARSKTPTAPSQSLPPEVIQRIVRQNFGRFRLCYEGGLRNNPNLQGGITVRFIIGVDGLVTNVSNGGSDLPDSGVVRCVVRAFYGLSFPSPGKGLAKVVYPILFSPGG